jgi:pilus assembly protein CpaE
MDSLDRVMLRGLVLGSEHSNWPALHRALQSTGRFSWLRRFDSIRDPHTLSRILRVHSPHIVILDLAAYPDLDSLLDLLSRASPSALMMAAGAGVEGQVLLQLMRVGIQEYLPIPCGQEEARSLLDRVEARLAKYLPAVDFTEMLFAWLPAKAGVGTSTLAAYISLALAQQLKQRALLVDLDVNNGLVPFLLRLSNPHSMVDILSRDLELDEEFWNKLVIRHDGLDVLASGESSFGGRLDPARVIELLAVARRLYQTLCIDLSGEMEDYSVAVMQESKDILLVCTPEAAVLHMARRRLARLKALGLGDRVRVIVNRVSSVGFVSAEQIPALLGQEVYATIRNDYRLIGEALLAGRRVSPHSPLGHDIALLAARLVNGPPPKAARAHTFRILSERLASLRNRFLGRTPSTRITEAQPLSALLALPAPVVSNLPEVAETPLVAATIPEPAPPAAPSPAPLSPQEFEALLSACEPKRKTSRPVKGLSAQRCHAIILVVWHTGMAMEEVLELSAADLQGCRLRSSDVPDPVAAEIRGCAMKESGRFFLPADASLPEAIKLLRRRLAEYGRKAGIKEPVFERLHVPRCPPDESGASLRNLSAALEPNALVSEDAQP